MARSMPNQLLVAGGLLAGAYWAAGQIVRRRRWFEFAGKAVVVVGGSRGLGLVLARKLVAQKARVVLCARTEADVRAAEGELRARGGQVLGIVCDIQSLAAAARRHRAGSAYGYQSQSAVSPSLLTALAEQAATRNNELRPRTHD